MQTAASTVATEMAAQACQKSLQPRGWNGRGMRCTVQCAGVAIAMQQVIFKLCFFPYRVPVHADPLRCCCCS